MARVATAVIPAAGRGTRFLPASKSIPKEMLPVVDRPAIQWVVEEAAGAGLDRVVVVTAEGKEAMADHFAPSPELEATLQAKGDDAGLAHVRRAATLAEITYVTQAAPLGLGHAVACAEDAVGGEPFAVLLGDDFVDPDDPVLPAMIALHEATGQSVVMLIQVPQELIRLYGSVDPSPPVAEDGVASLAENAEVYRITRLNEKPAPGDEYSDLAIVGRYVFTPAIFDALRETPPGRGGEIQLTDAIDRLARVPIDQGGGVFGLVYRGARFDTGDKLEYLKAVVHLATRHADIGPRFDSWLRGYVAGREETP